jgi:hypothetical protein
MHLSCTLGTPCWEKHSNPNKAFKPPTQPCQYIRFPGVEFPE